MTREVIPGSIDVDGSPGEQYWQQTSDALNVVWGRLFPEGQNQSAEDLALAVKEMVGLADSTPTKMEDLGLITGLPYLEARIHVQRAEPGSAHPFYFYIRTDEAEIRLIRGVPTSGVLKAPRIGGKSASAAIEIQQPFLDVLKNTELKSVKPGYRDYWEILSYADARLALEDLSEVFADLSQIEV